MIRIRWRLAWPGTCWYGFCPDEKTWERERRRVLRSVHIDIKDYPSTQAAVTHYRTPDARHLITLQESLDSQPFDLVNCIAHESVHVAMAIFESMSEDEPGEETMAYTVGRVSSDIFEDYIRTRGDRFRRLTSG